MSDFTYFERIESYVEGQLTPEDRQAFDRELDENTALKEEYEAYLATLQLIDELAYEKLREKVSMLEKKRIIKPVFIRKRSWSIAASVLLLIAVGSFWYANQNYTNQAIFADYYQPPNTDLVRGESAAETTYDQAVIAYQKHDLVSAINLLNGISSEASIYNNAQYLLGNIYLEAIQPEAAINTFTSLLSKQDKRYKENVEWQLVLAYLQHGQQDKAQDRLASILAQPNHPYHKSASDLNDTLKSFWRKLFN